LALFIYFSYTGGIFTNYFLLFLLFSNSYVALLFSPSLLLLVNTDLLPVFIPALILNFLLGLLNRYQKFFARNSRIISGFLYITLVQLMLQADPVLRIAELIFGTLLILLARLTDEEKEERV
jgi:hypothetical protein